MTIMTQIECVNCGQERKPGRGAHGYCGPCYSRWLRAGKPDSRPPDPKFKRDQEGHMDDYLFLVSTGVTDINVLAERIGVTRWSIIRYRSMVKLGSKLIRDEPNFEN